MGQEHQCQISVNPESFHTPTEHVRWTHIEQVPRVNQVQCQQQADGHVQDFLYIGSKDSLFCTKHSSHELLSPTRTQELKNLVISPRPQLTLCVLPPESSNCDLVGRCDEPSSFPFSRPLPAAPQENPRFASQEVEHSPSSSP